MDSGEPSSIGPTKRHKKGRTREKKSGNEPTANKAPKEDVVRTAPESTTKWRIWRLFQPGQPMLPPDKLSALRIEAQLLHNEVVPRSGKGEIYYTATVTEGIGFVIAFPADKIYLWFENVVNDNIFYVDVVRPSLMRLWSLWHATNPLVQNKEVAFLDPYHMHFANVDSDKGQRDIATYLHQTILDSPRHKDNFLVPYFKT